jgi:transposase
MRDVELYRRILGLEMPWTVTRVDLLVTEQRVDVWVGHAARLRWPCPTCGAELPVYDHAAERAWRHLDTCQFVTYLHARPPRVACPEHGVRQVRVPWAEPHARFTLLFERLAIDVLQECDIRGASRILRISWDEAWHLMERAVARGQRAKRPRVPTRLGVDEKAAAKGHRYLTLVCDLQHATVEYIAEDRRQASLDEYFQTLRPDQRAAIQAIAMDMWEPYVQSVLTYVPGGARKIVFDKYHIMSHLGTAVDTVRKREHRVLQATGDPVLAGSKYVWLYAGPNVPEKHQARLQGLLQRPLKTARAWAIKESFRDFWQYRRVGWATAFWRRWYFWATHSRLTPVIKVAKMLKRHLPNVLSYITHRITNAVSEGLNSKIQTIKKMAYGFRNLDHFKTAIYFHCGGLQLYPVVPTAADVTHGNPG